jgi:hypothetical protein
LCKSRISYLYKKRVKIGSKFITNLKLVTTHPK